jgi:hypothetical protein
VRLPESTLWGLEVFAGAPPFALFERWESVSDCGDPGLAPKTRREPWGTGRAIQSSCGTTAFRAPFRSTHCHLDQPKQSGGCTSNCTHAQAEVSIADRAGHKTRPASCSCESVAQIEENNVLTWLSRAALGHFARIRTGGGPFDVAEGRSPTSFTLPRLTFRIEFRPT